MRACGATAMQNQPFRPNKGSSLHSVSRPSFAADCTVAAGSGSGGEKKLRTSTTPIANSLSMLYASTIQGTWVTFVVGLSNENMPKRATKRLSNKERSCFPFSSTNYGISPPVRTFLSVGKTGTKRGDPQLKLQFWCFHTFKYFYTEVVPQILL